MAENVLERGGAPTWVTGSYDPDLNLLYWGTGNPDPDWDGDMRAGDNLYAASLLALNPDDGTLKWYYQFTPHDTHDWDANQVPVLADLPVAGQVRKVVMQANRNGFFTCSIARTANSSTKALRVHRLGKRSWRRWPACSCAGA